MQVLTESYSVENDGSYLKYESFGEQVIKWTSLSQLKFDFRGISVVN